MGKIRSSEPQQTESSISHDHFSHPHPLKLINYDHHHHYQNLNPSSCAGCRLKPSGLIYSCTTCNYFLHDKCFQMPKTITHPFHKEHPFTLLPTPAYDQGLFNCDACAQNGDAFSYHCKPCGIDLHILCAATPLSLTTVYHPHKLHLIFGSPYDTKNFVCDVCKLQGLDHWLYRCTSCGFDAHLKCATGAPPPTSIPVPQPQGHGVQYFAAAAGSRSTPVPQPQGHGVQYFAAAAAAPPMQQGFAPHNMMNVNPAVGFPAALDANRAQNEMFLQALKQIIQNQNAMTQAVMAGGLGGVGGGGDNRVQQLMQLMSSINGNGGFGGGGIPGGLNAFGGGGGGQELLQALMGGGGGGLESLQSLLGGGGGFDFLGGAGGLDLLGGLGGLF